VKELILLKLGGSSITKKADNKFEMNEEVLNNSAKEIAIALKEKEFNLIIICGVGPFGHTNVKEYDLNNGIKTKKQEEGTEKTIKDCDFVADKVIEALEKQKIKTRHVPGYWVCRQDNKKVTTYEIEEYEKALRGGEVPITTGIMVKDRTLKWSVMSGDTAIAQIIKQMKPSKIILGTDVDGIYTTDPKIDSNAKLIKEINKENLQSVIKMASESKAVDVTGGMKGKLEKLAEQLNGNEAQIFNLLIPGNLKSALLGKELNSTKIKL
jgi:isopentenyl phosphate kinase